MRYTAKEFEARRIHIKEIFPYYTHRQCYKCKDYIKKEKMWRGFYWDEFLADIDIAYACKKCCETKEEFLDYAKRRFL